MQFEVFMELLPLEAQQSVITQVTEELRSEAATSVAADTFQRLTAEDKKALIVQLTWAQPLEGKKEIIAVFRYPPTIFALVDASSDINGVPPWCQERRK